MGKEQRNKRIRNQYTVLRALHLEGPMQRGTISQKYGIRKSSITSIITGLVELGILKELTPGYMRSQVAIDPSAFHVICGHLDPEAFHAARVYLDGRIEDLQRMPLTQATDPERVLSQVAEALDNLRDTPGSHLLGLGLSVPGFVNSGEGLAIEAVNLKWKNIAVGRRLKDMLGQWVLVENDVRCKLWSALWFGRHAREVDNAVYLDIDFGVACAIYCHAERVAGSHFAAGEIGQIQVPDASGRPRSLESFCSVPAMLRHARRIDPSLVSIDELVAAADTPACVAVVDQAMQRLAPQLAGLLTALDPDLLFLGSASTALAHIILPILEQHLEAALQTIYRDNVRILVPEITDHPSLLGVAGLVMDDAFLHADVLQDTRVASA